MDVARNLKFGLYVNGSKSQPADDKSSLKRGRNQGHVTSEKKLKLVNIWQSYK